MVGAHGREREGSIRNTLLECGKYRNNQRVRLSKWVLCRRRVQNGPIKRYEARLVVWVSEEYDFNENSLAPVADYLFSKLLLFLSIQQGGVDTHGNSNNAFPNSLLKRAVYVQLPER